MPTGNERVVLLPGDGIGPEVSAEARLNDSKTARAIWDKLPIEARGETWGDEIYFDIGLTASAEAPREVVDVGDLAYWPPGTGTRVSARSTTVSMPSS